MKASPANQQPQRESAIPDAMECESMIRRMRRVFSEEIGEEEGGDDSSNQPGVVFAHPERLGVDGGGGSGSEGGDEGEEDGGPITAAPPRPTNPSPRHHMDPKSLGQWKEDVDVKEAVANPLWKESVKYKSSQKRQVHL